MKVFSPKYINYSSPIIGVKLLKCKTIFGKLLVSFKKGFDQTIPNNSLLMSINQFYDYNINTNSYIENRFVSFSLLQIDPNIFG